MSDPAAWREAFPVVTQFALLWGATFVVWRAKRGGLLPARGAAWMTTEIRPAQGAAPSETVLEVYFAAPPAGRYGREETVVEIRHPVVGPADASVLRIPGPAETASAAAARRATIEPAGRGAWLLRAPHVAGSSLRLRLSGIDPTARPALAFAEPAGALQEIAPARLREVAGLAGGLWFAVAVQLFACIPAAAAAPETLAAVFFTGEAGFGSLFVSALLAAGFFGLVGFAALVTLRVAPVLRAHLALLGAGVPATPHAAPPPRDAASPARREPAGV